MNRSLKHPSVLHLLGVSLLTRRAGKGQKPTGQQQQCSGRPLPTDQAAWAAYWQQQGQPWRTEPEIDQSRQAYLAKRRTITPDITQGIYPFKDIKLSRADVEWLLATHEERYGFTGRNERSPSGQMGLDLRGANLSQVDLHGLPLADLRGGLSSEEWRGATEEQCRMAAVHMEGADLRWIHLERADLRWAYLEGADLTWAYLEDAGLRHAHLEKARLRWTILDRCAFYGSHLEDADLRGCHLELRSSNAI